MKHLIKKILMEEKLPLTPQKLIKSLPKDLKELLFKQWDAKQNPEWHPEGNTLKHILVVLKRAYHHYPDDPNMIMTALFHDLGKSDTYSINPKTNQPTAYGHEYKSTDYVEKFRDWIESFEGTDVDEIKYLVRNHMKVKPSTWNQMRDIKKEPIKLNPLFDKLMGFTDKLDGGGTDLKESITRILKEETKPKYKIDKYKIDGFDVYVGKNSESNEYLTMEMSDDSDLWFHTKKYPGTHVILSLNGMEPTRESIIFCSKLAKENSKGSEKDNVEVVYCYIRDIFKTNDMRVGQVDVHPSKLKEIVV